MSEQTNNKMRCYYFCLIPEKSQQDKCLNLFSLPIDGKTEKQKREPIGSRPSRGMVSKGILFCLFRPVACHLT